jgi:hypothetical protein
MSCYVILMIAGVTCVFENFFSFTAQGATLDKLLNLGSSPKTTSFSDGGDYF